MDEINTQPEPQAFDDTAFNDVINLTAFWLKKINEGDSHKLTTDLFNDHTEDLAD